MFFFNTVYRVTNVDLHFFFLHYKAVYIQLGQIHHWSGFFFSYKVCVTVTDCGHLAGKEN